MLTVMMIGIFVCAGVSRSYADISHGSLGPCRLKGENKPLLAGDIEFALIGPDDAEISCVGSGSGG